MKELWVQLFGWSWADIPGGLQRRVVCVLCILNEVTLSGALQVEISQEEAGYLTFQDKCWLVWRLLHSVSESGYGLSQVRQGRD